MSSAPDQHPSPARPRPADLLTAETLWWCFITREPIAREEGVRHRMALVWASSGPQGVGDSAGFGGSGFQGAVSLAEVRRIERDRPAAVAAIGRPMRSWLPALLGGTRPFVVWMTRRDQLQVLLEAVPEACLQQRREQIAAAPPFTIIPPHHPPGKWLTHLNMPEFQAVWVMAHDTDEARLIAARRWSRARQQDEHGQWQVAHAMSEEDFALALADSERRVRTQDTAQPLVDWRPESIRPPIPMPPEHFVDGKYVVQPLPWERS